MASTSPPGRSPPFFRHAPVTPRPNSRFGGATEVEPSTPRPESGPSGGPRLPPTRCTMTSRPGRTAGAVLALLAALAPARADEPARPGRRAAGEQLALLVGVRKYDPN